MALQFSVALRNNRLDQIESTIGAAGKLYLYTGAVPANCAAADAGTVLATMALPSDWMNAASNGSKMLQGTWSTTAFATGTVGYFRLKDNSGATCHLQGSVTISGGGGDMTLDNNAVAVNQTINITTFTVTDGNA